MRGTITTAQRGFSYVDVMIAITILLVGCLALAAAMTGAIVTMDESEEQLRAKQLAVSTMESIFSARDIKNASFGWDKIENVSDGGVFPDGVVAAVYSGAGADGIVGTADDGATPNGPDGVAGTVDDSVLLRGFTRKIEVTTQSDSFFNPPRRNLKTVVVTVNYLVSGRSRSVSLTSELADYNFN